MNFYNIFEQYQSGFRTNTVFINRMEGVSNLKHQHQCTAETVNGLRQNMDINKSSLLALLDSSAALDTVDLSILLERLHMLIGISN